LFETAVCNDPDMTSFKSERCRDLGARLAVIVLRSEDIGAALIHPIQCLVNKKLIEDFLLGIARREHCRDLVECDQTGLVTKQRENTKLDESSKVS